MGARVGVNETVTWAPVTERRPAERLRAVSLVALVLIATGARLRVDPQVFRVLEQRFHEVAEFFAASAYSPATSPEQARRWAAAVDSRWAAWRMRQSKRPLPARASGASSGRSSSRFILTGTG